MNCKAKGARTERQASVRCAARTRDREPVLVMPAPASPALDERIPGFLLDAFAPVEAAIASAATGVPYAAMRRATEVDEDGRRKLLCAAKAVVAEHPQFFAKHLSEFEFIVPFMAITAAQVDHLLRLKAVQQAESEMPPQPCSWREAAMIGALVLAPVLLLAGFAIYKLLKEG